MAGSRRSLDERRIVPIQELRFQTGEWRLSVRSGGRGGELDARHVESR